LALTFSYTILKSITKLSENAAKCENAF